MDDMLRCSILIGVILMVSSSIAWSNRKPADNIVRNGTNFPVNVTIELTNGIYKKLIPAGGTIQVQGDIESLRVFATGTQSGIQSASCDGVYESAIDIDVKNNKLECK